MRIRVYLLMILWLIFQYFIAVSQHNGTTSISALSHFGGAIAGLVCWFFWRNQPELAQRSAQMPMEIPGLR